MGTEVFETLGEDTMMDPSTAEGRARLLRWANRAQRRVAFFRLKSGHLLRFPTLRVETMWQAVAYTDTATYTVASSTDNTVTCNNLPGVTANRYRGWVVEINDEHRLVVSQSGSTLTINDDWNSNPAAADTYKLYKRWYDLVDSGHAYASENIILDPVSAVYEILVLEDLQEEVSLVYDDRIETNIFTLKETGDPTTLRMDGNRIYLDYNVEDTRYFRMEYYKYPAEMSADADEPDLPEVFHEAVLMEMERLAYRFKNQNNSAYSLKRDIEDFMNTVMLPGEMGFERRNPYTEVVT
jgi:hypothetical protein